MLMRTQPSDPIAVTALSDGNAAYIEDLYDQFLKDPRSVDSAWREYFEQLADGARGEVAHGPIRERLSERVRQPAAVAVPSSQPTELASAKQGAVSRLIQVYANRGHLVAKLDPLGLQIPTRPYVLDLAYFGLSDADLDTEFFTGSRTQDFAKRASLREILEVLRFVYTETIGAEFAHVSDTDERLWLQDHFQSALKRQRVRAD